MSLLTCSSSNLQERPFLKIPSSTPQIKNIWRGLVIKSYTYSLRADGKRRKIIPDQNWITLKGKDGKLLIKIADIALLLNQSVLEVKGSLQDSLSMRELNKALQVRYSFQPWERLHNFLKVKLPDEADNLLSMVKGTYEKVIAEKLLLQDTTSVQHFTRKILKTPLPLERSSGQVYAILKSSKISEPFSRGYMKNLFYAVNLITLQPVAWAKINLGLVHSAESHTRRTVIFQEEALQVQLSLPTFVKHIHTTYWQGSKGMEKAGMTMELCDGDVESLIKKIHGPIHSGGVRDLAIFWNILEDLLSALAHLESEPIKIHHRDIKPANLFFLQTDGTYRGKVGDFGFATKIEEEKLRPESHGSPLFIAPEFLQGMEIIMAGIKLHNDAMAKLELYHLAQKRERELLVKNNLLSKCIFVSQQKRDEATQEFKSEIMNMQNWGARQLADSNGLKIQAKSLVAQGVNMVASTKGDLWAMGLTLFEMRTGKYPLALFTNTSVLEKMTPSEFYILLKGVNQKQIDAVFSTAHPNTLEFLNFQMLTLDPAKRPSATVCLERVQELRKNNAKFL